MVVELIQELSVGLDNISFEDNFKSFLAENIEIRAGQVATLGNHLREGLPTKYIIVDQIGASLVTRSEDNPWTTSFLYLKNTGSEDVTISVLFIK